MDSPSGFEQCYDLVNVCISYHILRKSKVVIVYPELLDISVFDGSSSLNIRMDMLVDANMQQQ